MGREIISPPYKRRKKKDNKKKDNSSRSLSLFFFFSLAVPNGFFPYHINYSRGTIGSFCADGRASFDRLVPGPALHRK